MLEKEVIGNQIIGKGIRISDLEKAEAICRQIEVYGLDGYPLLIEFDENSLRIFEDEHYLFSATLVRETVHFSIKNELDGQRSRNIFPRQLMGFSLERWGRRVELVRTSWNVDEGTNSQEYFAARSQGKTPQQAALTTWSGRALSSEDFTQVIKVRETAEWIFAYFSR